MGSAPRWRLDRTMAVVTEAELAAILDHCRALVDAADQLDRSSRERVGKATAATARWEGDFRDVFIQRFDHEADDLLDQARGFRAEADAWASVWATTVDHLNHQRRQAAVDRISDARGTGERFVDVFVGDDSGQQVRPVEPVLVPTAATRFAATGGLERF